MNTIFALAAAPAAAETTSTGGGYQMIILLVLMVVVMYFTMIRPQKKRQKVEQKMRDDLQIGDEVTTIGGIMGRVVTIKDDSLVIETGADRTKLRFTRTSIGVNNTQQEKLQAEREAQQKAADEARANKVGSRAKASKKDKDE